MNDSEMKLYHWSSERFASYHPGSIIVMAKDVKEARRKVMKEYKRIHKYKQIREIEYDISLEPTILESHVSFEYGSD